MKNKFVRDTINLLRAIIPKPLRRYISRLGIILGEPESELFPSIYLTLKYLREWKYCPETIVDVGAYQGDWTKMAKEVFPTAKILMVEPQESKKKYLKLFVNTITLMFFWKQHYLAPVKIKK